MHLPHVAGFRILEERSWSVLGLWKSSQSQIRKISSPFAVHIAGKLISKNVQSAIPALHNMNHCPMGIFWVKGWKCFSTLALQKDQLACCTNHVMRCFHLTEQHLSISIASAIPEQGVSLILAMAISTQGVWCIVFMNSVKSTSPWHTVYTQTLIKQH